MTNALLAAGLHAAGFTLQEFLGAGCNVSDSVAAGYELSDIGTLSLAREFELTAKEARPAACTFANLKGAGYPLSEARNAGATASDAKSCGYPLCESKDAGYSASEAMKAGVTRDEVCQAG